MRARLLTHSSGPDALPRGWQKEFKARYTALRLAGRVTEEPEVQAARKAGARAKRKILP